MNFQPVKWMQKGLVWHAAAVLALSAVVSWPACAQEQQQNQQQQGQSQSQPGQSQRDQGQPQGQAAPAQTPQQNPNRPPVTSRDRIPNNPSNAAPGASEPRPYDQQGRPSDDQSGQPPDAQPPYNQRDEYGWPPYDRQYGYGGSGQQNGQYSRPPYGSQQYGGQQYGEQNAQPQHYAPPPAVLTIPAGTVVVVRTNEFLSSDKNQAGDQFTGTLQQPIVVDGYVVARRGQTVVGQVKDAKKAGRVKGTSELGVELTDLTLVDGTQSPVLTELWKASGGTSHGADAATIVGGTALGSAIGAAADWGRGAAIGAGAGAAAGIGAVLLTRGRPTVVPPEAELSFKLVDPVKVDTAHGASAFVPPAQEDFGYGRPALRGYGYGPNHGPYEGGPSPYAYGPAPCGYYYPCYYGYPGPYVAVYPWAGWGWGFYGRGFYGPRFRRF